MSKCKKIVGKMLKSIEAGKQLDADIKNSIKKTGILFVVTVVFIGVGLFFGKRITIEIATVNIPLWLAGGFFGLVCGCSVFVWFRTLANVFFRAWCFWIGSVLIALMGLPLTWVLWPKRKKRRPPISSKPEYSKSKIAS